MEFEELLQKVSDESLRSELKSEYQKVNQVKGEYGNKLKLKDGEIDGLKAERQTYSKAHDALKKSGIDADQIPKLLEKLGYQKTLEEEYELTKTVLTEKSRKEQELMKENNRLKAEKAMKAMFDKQRAELKDEKGQPFKVVDDFVDFDKLYDVTDFSNEAVLQEKCKQVLAESFTKQTEVMRKIGFLGVETHKTPDGKQTSSPVSPDLPTIMKERGAAAAIQAMRDAALARQR